jgi:hypothetical protein
MSIIGFVCVCVRVCVCARVRACRALLSDFKDDEYKEKTTRMKEQGTYQGFVSSTSGSQSDDEAEDEEEEND